MNLEKGPVKIELVAPAPTGARRQIDCLCLTTDTSYRPRGREKPDLETWKVLRELRAKRAQDSAPALLPAADADLSKALHAAENPVRFFFKVAPDWLKELKESPPRDAFYCVDPPIVTNFLAVFPKGAPVFSNRLSGPVWHIPYFPTAFEPGSPFLSWLERHPDRHFDILLNYGEPKWPANADRAGIRSNLLRFKNQFAGYIAGEAISYAAFDTPTMEQRVREAKSRGEILQAFRELHTAGTVKKFSDYAGSPLTPEEAWAPVISCLSAGMESFSHALFKWGCRTVGHESTGNSPTLSRRLAFLRGAARQFGGKFANYQSCNLGDASTLYSRQNYFFPASSRYVLDNQYDVWAGAGVNWLLKDYLLFNLAGASVFHHEQGIDMFWKPGGNSAGDTFPVQLSPKGKAAELMVRLAKEPRGVSYTPVAFLLDEAHGFAQERFRPGAFGLDPELNPGRLRPGAHEASIRAWFDVAWFPAPDTQNEPSSAIRQTYVNGMFGDIFDVIVTAPERTEILKAYPVVILAGEVALTKEWGVALEEFIRKGGTLIPVAGQLSGPGAARLSLAADEKQSGRNGAVESALYVWNTGTERLPANRFQVQPMSTEKVDVLASTDGGAPVAVRKRVRKGEHIHLLVPMGLGIDGRPVPLLGHILNSVMERRVPLQVQGDVEWTLNSLAQKKWLVGLLNNRGVHKTQHGFNATDFREEQAVTLRYAGKVRQVRERITGETIPHRATGGHTTIELAIPAGAVRLLEIN